VIIDTGVFGARLTPRGQSLASAYRPLLEGRPAVISFITVAELRYGAKLAGWGTARLPSIPSRPYEIPGKARNCCARVASLCGHTAEVVVSDPPIYRQARSFTEIGQ
jgi:hypothetical protein